MTDGLMFSASEGRLFRGRSALDAWHWRWAGADALPDDAAPVGAREAVRAVFGAGGARLVPVAVIGPREPSAEEAVVAEALGHALGALRVPLLTGGKGGVMEAAARGAHTAGGLAIGLLPEDDWRGANAFTALPIATGIGKARNALIAQAAVALVAVGGQYGTHVEAAYGLHFGKRVLGLCEPPNVPGLERMADTEAAVDTVCRIVLRLDEA